MILDLKNKRILYSINDIPSITHFDPIFVDNDTSYSMAVFIRDPQNVVELIKFEVAKVNRSFLPEWSCSSLSVYC